MHRPYIELNEFLLYGHNALNRLKITYDESLIFNFLFILLIIQLSHRTWIYLNFKVQRIMFGRW